MRAALTLLTALLLSSGLPDLPAAAADPLTLTLDGSTAVEFTLKSTLHTVHGTMILDHGSIRFDPETGIADGEVVVSAGSAVTGNGSRDRKMHEDVLLSTRYPVIEFRPTRFEGTVLDRTDPQEVRLIGELRLLGQPHQVVIPARLTWSENTVEGTGTLTVPFVEWGLKDPSVLVLRTSKEVLVDLTIHGTVSP